MRVKGGEESERIDNKRVQAELGLNQSCQCLRLPTNPASVCYSLCFFVARQHLPFVCLPVLSPCTHSNGGDRDHFEKHRRDQHDVRCVI